MIWLIRMVRYLSVTPLRGTSGPDAPKEYGSATFSVSLSAFPRMAAMQAPAFRLPPIDSPDIEHEEGRTIIRFTPVDLRPHETVSLDPITLYSTQKAADSFVGEWRASATNVSGTVRQRLLIPAQHLEVDLRQVLPPLISDDIEA
jgi:hypothetical protein